MKTYLFTILFFFSSAAILAQATKIAVINDLNSSLGTPSYSTSVSQGINRIIAERVDLVIVPGDMIAGGNKQVADKLPQMWTAFAETVHKSFKEVGIPLAPSPGNHDASIWQPDDQVQYQQYFKKEENIPNIEFVDKTHYPLYYSYTKNNVFFLALDDTNEHWLRGRDREIDGIHRQWIKNQLASQKALQAKARIAYGHIPLYTVLDKRRYVRKSKEILIHEQFQNGHQNNLEQLLTEGNVNLAIFGHSHAYYPGYVKHQELNNKLHMLFSPCLGSGERILQGTSERSKRGYTIIDVDHAGTISYQVFTVDGQLLDSHALPKKIETSGVTIHRDDEYLK